MINPYRHLEIKARIVICFLSLFAFLALLFLGYLFFNFNLSWIIIFFISFSIIMGAQLFMKFFFKKTLKCPQCGTSVSVYSEYCPTCGFQLLKRCHNCSTYMRYDEKVCRKCSAKSKLLIIPNNAKIELRSEPEEKRKENGKF